MLNILLYQETIPYEECVKAITEQNQTEICLNNHIVDFSEIVPDLFQCIELTNVEKGEFIAKVKA